MVDRQPTMRSFDHEHDSDVFDPTEVPVAGRPLSDEQLDARRRSAYDKVKNLQDSSHVESCIASGNMNKMGAVALGMETRTTIVPSFQKKKKGSKNA